MTETKKVSGAMALEAKAKALRKEAEAAADWLTMRHLAREEARCLAILKTLPREEAAKPAPKPKLVPPAEVKKPEPAAPAAGFSLKKETNDE